VGRTADDVLAVDLGRQDSAFGNADFLFDGWLTIP